MTIQELTNKFNEYTAHIAAKNNNNTWVAPLKTYRTTNITLEDWNSVADTASDLISDTTSIEDIISTIYNYLLELSSTIPTKTSDLVNDSGFLTQHQSLAAYRTSTAQDLIDAGKQSTINDLVTIRSGAALGATSVQPSALSSYATTAQLATKQNVIDDLLTIRNGADLGATAVQPSAISDMATKSWTNLQLNGKENADATIIKQANVVNTLVSTSTEFPLSAYQGKVLSEHIANVEAGKSKGYVVNNASDITGNPITYGVRATAITGVDISKLKIGDNIYVVQHDVPDYWVSAVATGYVDLKYLETEKVIVPDATGGLARTGSNIYIGGVYTSGNNGKVLSTDGNGNTSWISVVGGGVTSIGGSTGAITLKANNLKVSGNQLSFASGSASQYQVIMANGFGGAGWNNITASVIDSTGASSGQVLTATGSGQASWQNVNKLYMTTIQGTTAIGSFVFNILSSKYNNTTSISGIANFIASLPSETLFTYASGEYNTFSIVQFLHAQGSSSFSINYVQGSNVVQLSSYNITSLSVSTSIEL